MPKEKERIIFKSSDNLSKVISFPDCLKKVKRLMYFIQNYNYNIIYKKNESSILILREWINSNIHDLLSYKIKYNYFTKKIILIFI